MPSLLRVTPATAITFVIYEKMSHFLTQSTHNNHNNNSSCNNTAAPTLPSMTVVDVSSPHRIQGPST